MFDVFVGIDPGKTGGIATIYPDGVDAIKMPATEHDVAQAFHNLFVYPGNLVVYLEKVHSMPQQGVRSVFTFGQNYGFLRGCLCSLKIRFEEVRPNQWQKALSCQSGGDKNVTKAKAQQLFPDIKMTHAKADSLLIAEYGRRKELGLL